jgi:hypothetical protein
VVYFAIHQELERSPHHRQIVIDPHQRIMNSLLNVRRTRFSHAVGKSFKRHLSRLAVPHQHHRAAGQQRFPDRICVAFRHAIKQCHYRRQDRLLFWCCGVQQRNQKTGACYTSKK